nr:immunoglobulin light chain junction region [Macaca mulatta]
DYYCGVWDSSLNSYIF